ncbi:hypothetical protein WN55_07170 [Dufourea novaeangliae]|uniref:Uncharacterized protein n=1 Tax=Dufourea novaeangliae TaxID=178035 RepID=A0A154P424_DUFNO|nr:hypothetical protein WN55_07170 [Dufourea novaeangliae]
MGAKWEARLNEQNGGAREGHSEEKKCQIRETHAQRIFVNLVSYVRLESCGETSNCPNCRFYINKEKKKTFTRVHRPRETHTYTDIRMYTHGHREHTCMYTRVHATRTRSFRHLYVTGRVKKKKEKRAWTSVRSARVYI